MDTLTCIKLNSTEVRPISMEESFFACVGNTLVWSQYMLILFVSAWCLYPVNSTVQQDATDDRNQKKAVFWGVFWTLGIAAIAVPASGGMDGRNVFSWIKLYSVVIGNASMTRFKLFEPQRKWITTAWFTFVFSLNILEAIIWELAFLQKQPYNYLNALIGGGILLATIQVYAWKLGTSIKNKTRVQCNLPLMWIILYTCWNIKYNAVYHPTLAIWYIFVSLLTPLFAAIVLDYDWLEARVVILQHAIVLQNLYPLNRIQFMTRNMGLDVLTNEAFLWSISCFSVLLGCVVILETVYIWKKGLPYFIWMRIETSGALETTWKSKKVISIGEL